MNSTKKNSRCESPYFPCELENVSGGHLALCQGPGLARGPYVEYHCSRFLTSKQNKNKAAFGISIYAVKCGIYPFVTPESSSDMRAGAEADVTRRHRGGVGGGGVKNRHVRRHFFTSVLITHVWEGRSMRSEEL